MKEKFEVQLSEIKKKAKQLKKEKSIPYHQALDEAAQFFGFTNYKNYKNELENFRQKLAAALEAGADFAMNEQDKKMAEKLHLLYPAVENFSVPVENLINMFKTTKHTDEAIQSLCEKESTLKEYLELCILKDSLENIDWDLVTVAPYHIPKNASLKNLIYKFSKNAFDEETDSEQIFVEGDFEVKCETMFEHTQEDINSCAYGFFEEQILFGPFELMIDRKKHVTIEEMDIGHYL